MHTIVPSKNGNTKCDEWQIIDCDEKSNDRSCFYKYNINNILSYLTSLYLWEMCDGHEWVLIDVLEWYRYG